MLLIQNGNIFNPRALGVLDILIGGSSILAMEKSIDVRHIPGEVRVIDATGMNIVPGFIDGHQHFTGGGGEGGFQSRTPEMTLSMNVKNGVTTAVGLLGTDSLTRTVENLYAKTKAFNAEGITAFMLTGAYWLPSPTISGDVGRDITYHDSVIGVKLAMADQRGPQYNAEELAKLASDVRVAALVAAKPGVITIHCGINPDGLDLIFEAVEKYAIRTDIFIPTHVNRKRSKIADQSLELAEQGAHIDATCMKRVAGEDENYLNAADFALICKEKGVFDKLCFSSDAGGSLPKWSEDRSRIVGMGVGTPDSLNFELKRLVQDLGMDLAEALKPLTTTPAEVYGLSGIKGELSVGADADLLVTDSQSMNIRDVIARGQVMMKDEILEKKGYFE